MDSNLYKYNLPEELIAKQPATPRDTSRLFVYDTKTESITFSNFRELDNFLPKKSFLVLNDTKVIPARIELKKPTGGKVICLLLMNELIKKDLAVVVKTLPDRKINVGEKLFIDQKHSFSVIYQNQNIFYLKLDFPLTELYDLLNKKGHIPIPLYLRKTALTETELRKKYQTVFAARSGSVAAPTASLHFTDSLFKKLGQKGIKKYFVTLHVGMGTFAPIDKKNIENKKLHEEFYEINKNDYREFGKLKNNGYKLIAAGTTTVRTLESAALNPGGWEEDGVGPKTNLFIMPPYDFKMVDILITNFHLPESSLMMLVEAFLQHKGALPAGRQAKKHLIELYNIAIKEKFRFFSFGDSMLIL